MEQELRALLLGYGPLSALLADRIHWDERPQGEALPGVILQGVDRRQQSTLNGLSGLYIGRVQIDAHALTRGAALSIADQIEARLDHCRAGGFLFMAQDGRRNGRAGGGKDGPRIFSVSMDFNTTWKAV
jgi:hypothetical protein